MAIKIIEKINFFIFHPFFKKTSFKMLDNCLDYGVHIHFFKDIQKKLEITMLLNKKFIMGKLFPSVSSIIACFFLLTTDSGSREPDYWVELYNDGYTCYVTSHESRVDLRAKLWRSGYESEPQYADEIVWERQLPGQSFQTYTTGTYTLVQQGCHEYSPPCINSFNMRVKMLKENIWYTSNTISVNFICYCNP